MSGASGDEQLGDLEVREGRFPGYRTGGGELLWPQACAEEVAREMIDSGTAIVGGEIYVRGTVAWASFVTDWTTTRGEDERRSAYLARCFSETLEKIRWGFAQEMEVGESFVYFFAASSSD